MWLPPLTMEVPKLEYYVVQKRETSRLAWTNVASEVQLTKLKVTKLLKGNEYIFRVMAVNKYGVGEPLDSEPVVAVDPYGPPDPPKTPKLPASLKIPWLSAGAILTLMVAVRSSITLWNGEIKQANAGWMQQKDPYWFKIQSVWADRRTWVWVPGHGWERRVGITTERYQSIL